MSQSKEQIRPACGNNGADCYVPVERDSGVYHSYDKCGICFQDGDDPDVRLCRSTSSDGRKIHKRMADVGRMLRPSSGGPGNHSLNKRIADPDFTISDLGGDA